MAASRFWMLRAAVCVSSSKPFILLLLMMMGEEEACSRGIIIVIDRRNAKALATQDSEMSIQYDLLFFLRSFSSR
jgi:hypothetical protein